MLARDDDFVHEAKILRPFNRSEAMSLREVADATGWNPETARRRADLDFLGRLIAGQWRVSRVALAMFLDGDRAAHAAYLRGDRSSPIVQPYLERCGLWPFKPFGAGETTSTNSTKPERLPSLPLAPSGPAANAGTQQR
jgi:hypothetical protein